MLAKKPLEERVSNPTQDTVAVGGPDEGGGVVGGGIGTAAAERAGQRSERRRQHPSKPAEGGRRNSAVPSRTTGSPARASLHRLSTIELANSDWLFPPEEAVQRYAMTRRDSEGGQGLIEIRVGCVPACPRASVRAQPPSRQASLGWPPSEDESRHNLMNERNALIQVRSPRVGWAGNGGGMGAICAVRTH